MTTVNVTVVVGNARSVSAALAAVAAASTTIANLTAGTTPTGAELLPVSQGGVTRKLTLTQIINALTSGMPTSGGTFTGDVVFDQGAAGVVRIKLVSGLLTIGLFANATDTQPILTLGSILGAGAVSYGPGGSTAPDTFLLRSGVGEISGASATTIAVPRVVKTVAVTTNRTMLLTDLGKLLEVSQTGLRTQTVPPHSSVAFPVGCFVYVAMVNTGTVAIAAGAGVTIRDPDSLSLTISTQYETRRLFQRATDEWVMTKGGPA
jgi:hypothetical protein